MKLYLNLFDKESLITDQNILNSHKKQREGINTKHVVTISGIETQVFTESQLKHNRLFLYGVQITNPTILATYKKKGSGKNTEHYVEIDGQETRVFNANQLSHNRLFLDGVQITDLNILATYKKKGNGKNTEHYVEIDGQEKRVFTAVQLSQNRLFLDGVQITDSTILATYKKKGRGSKAEHYVEIDGQERRVFTAVQLSQNRLFLDGVQITDLNILATYKKKGSGRNTEHYVEIDGQEKRVFTAGQISLNRLFLDGVQITDPTILATYKKKGSGRNTEHYVEIDGQEKRVFTAAQLAFYRSKYGLTETSNDQVYSGSVEIEEPETGPFEIVNLDTSPRMIIDNIMSNMISSSNPSGADENTNHDQSTNAAEHQNEFDVADDAAKIFLASTDEENDGESVDQAPFKKPRVSSISEPEIDPNLDAGTIIDNLMNNMISTSNQINRPVAQPSHPSVVLFNSHMFFANQARLQNVSNDTNQDVTTPSSVYNQQVNCLKAMSNWLNALSLDAIQQHYPVCPAAIINFKSDIAELCATLIDSVLTRLIPQEMVTKENLMKLRYIKAFQYNSATPFDHQCLQRFIKCVENKMNSLNQSISQTNMWKSNLR